MKRDDLIPQATIAATTAFLLLSVMAPTVGRALVLVVVFGAPPVLWAWWRLRRWCARFDAERAQARRLVDSYERRG